MSANKVTHVTESVADRKRDRELAEARASGAVAPQVDVKTGTMINPHNPEFLTKRPWYLGNNDGPSLDHQADQRLDKDRLELSLRTADELVRKQRSSISSQRVKSKFVVGMWVEALKHNRQPYKICQITKIKKIKGLKKKNKSDKNANKEFDLKYEDGTVERKVRLLNNSSGNKPRIRITQTGIRSQAIDAEVYGKETFDSKRDEYHGYDTQRHNQLVEQKFQQREQLRQQIRQQQKAQHKEDEEEEEEGNDEKSKKKKKNKKKRDEKKKEAASDSDVDSDVDSDSDVSNDNDDSDDEEFAQRDEDAKVITSRLARQGGVGGAQMKVTARNLRIREDTAKYLHNLDINSAYYDPKSRSMRDNPNPNANPEDLIYAGDNFTRISGDAVKFAETQLFAWEAQKKIGATTKGGGGGGDENDNAGDANLHPQANPSQAELLKNQFKSKSIDIDKQRKKALLEKYGGSQYLDGSQGLATAVEDNNNNDDKNNPDNNSNNNRKTRFGVSTVMEEYKPDTTGIGGTTTDKNKQKKKIPAMKSKYEEDVFINGHYTVWGSYFHKGAFTWGYADDHSLIKNSYCTGENGRIANDEANEMKYGTGAKGSAALAQARKMLTTAGTGKSSSSSSARAPPIHQTSELYGEVDDPTSGSQELDSEKLQKAIDKQRQKRGGGGGNEIMTDDRKRKYNSMKGEEDINVTKEDMEAYRLVKERKNDPMANLDSDKLLDY